MTMVLYAALLAVGVTLLAITAVRVLVGGMAFEDFDGKTVYHCHILDHEDRGMMGTVLAQ